MTNNTPVYWDANGFSLHTKAWSVKSFGGKRFFSSQRRGSNAQIPFHQGQIYKPKVRESLVLSVKMWVLPIKTDGTRPAPVTGNAATDRAIQAHANWRAIRDACDVEGQFPLRKRWYANDGSILQATAQAELIEGNGPDADDGTGFSCDLQFLLADPYFYSDPVSQPAGTFTVLGDAPTRRVTLTMGNGRITTPDGNWIQYNGTGTAVIDCDAATAKKGTAFVNGQVTRNPKFPEWLTLQPGSNAITGSGTIAYVPAWK